MPTYTVKSGDRLGEIARQLGVPMSSISGYKSGDPNKIQVGENLTYKKPATYTDILGSGLLNTSKTLNPTVSGKSSGGGLGGGSGSSWGSTTAPTYNAPKTTPTPAPTPTPTPASTPAPVNNQPEEEKSQYDTTKKTEYGKSRDDAFESLTDLRTKTYENEYKTRGLEEVKGRIAQLDDEITTLRNERDGSVLKTKQNPYLSASALTGDVSKLSENYNSRINNLIQQRNAVAGEYNTGLTEIETAVDNAVNDKTTALNYYGGLYGAEQDAESTYTKMLMDQLKEDTQADQFDRQLAQALEIAQMRGGGGSGNLQLKTDPYGQPLYWYGSDGSIIPIEGDTSGLGGTTNYADMLAQMRTGNTQEEESGAWWNPLTWFN